MPSYMSHAIFGESLYNKIKIEKNLFSDILIDDLKMFSLGADLSYYCDHGDYTHNYKTKEFFLEMIKYIKQQGLYMNKSIMAYLYGHLGHYYLDKNVHPLVYYNSVNMKTASILPTHILIELYIDYYYGKK